MSNEKLTNAQVKKFEDFLNAFYAFTSSLTKEQSEWMRDEENETSSGLTLDELEYAIEQFSV